MLSSTMPIFKSKHPNISFPDDVTIWEWLLEESSEYCPLTKYPENKLAGFVDAITKERVSWKDVKAAATFISTSLTRDYGLQEGDTVSLFSRNTIWYPVMLFAAMRVGGVVSGASPAYNVDEMTYALRTANAKFIATHPTSIDIALQSAKNVGIPKKHIFLLEGQLEGYTTIKELIARGERYGDHDQAPYAKLPRGKKNGSVCALLSFSSGTTGLPKAVMISHQNVIAQALQIIPITPADHKKVLGVLPMFHITGLVHSMHLPLVINAEVIMVPAFSMETMLKTIVEYQIPEILVVPPILIRLARDPLVDKYDLRCVKRLSSGAAPVSEEILQLLQKKLPRSGFKQGYGMTESCSCITAHPLWAYDYRHAHKVGTIVASTEVKVIKEDGTEAGVGESGEILARGPQITIGYLNNEKATCETFDTDGFLHTGDQGFVDTEGFITITDRIKELIKVKGIGVAPAELEDLLLGHPTVEDCAVLAILDDRTGERPKAFVVVKKGHRADHATGLELIAYVEKHKTRHK
ncbi:acetyl-CoA synthetase-like protein [Xylaria bambusicola]|uniref:acetyl-CoA synthetase-like protein n=1 Tax=Xylaria bambusicola TaxID=326684 RepID=UPI002007F1E3|nr:acetyl-CoA synthetase-like protein [Xylaria bambusicola]KAI0522100.1 acetyl-CoA synthetase-like protein [Xylaria bambusicola]